MGHVGYIPRKISGQAGHSVIDFYFMVVKSSDTVEILVLALLGLDIYRVSILLGVIGIQ
jgi:hypothetical protein